MVLSRILSPKEYGIVSVAQVFLLFFTTIVDAGLGPAIIQNKKLTEYDIRVLYSFSILFSIFLWLVFLLITPLIAIIYSNYIYIPLCIYMSFVLLFQGLNIVPNAIMEKKKQFREINIRLILSNFFGGIAGIISAYAGFGVFSLITSFFIPAITVFIFNGIFVKLKPKKKLDILSLKKVLNFASNQFSFNFINYFSRNFDKLYVGKILGDNALGNYSKSYQILMLPNQIFMNILNPVLLPILSDYQNDRIYIKNFFIKLFKIICLFGMPLSIFLCLQSGDIIFVLFGNQWSDAIVPCSILSLSVWIQMSLAPTGTIFQTFGETRRLFLNGCITAVIMICSVIIGCFLGNITYLSIVLLVGFLINFVCIYLLISKKTLHISFFVFVKELVSPLILSIIEAFVLIICNLHFNFNHIISLVIEGVIFTFIFISYLLITQEYKFIRRR